MYFRVCADRSSESSQRLRQIQSALESAGSTTTDENDSKVIELPDYWVELVHEESVTVNLTAIGKNKDKKITNGELLAYMDENISQKAAEQGREQNPSLAGNPDKVLMSYR